MRGSSHFFRIAELQFRKHKFRQKPKPCPDCRVRANFYEKRKRIMTWRREEVSTAGSQQAGLLLSYTWLGGHSVFRRSVCSPQSSWLGPLLGCSGKSQSDWPSNNSHKSAETQGARPTGGSSPSPVSLEVLRVVRNKSYDITSKHICFLASVWPSWPQECHPPEQGVRLGTAFMARHPARLLTAVPFWAQKAVLHVCVLTAISGISHYKTGEAWTDSVWKR